MAQNTLLLVSVPTALHQAYARVASIPLRLLAECIGPGKWDEVLVDVDLSDMATVNRLRALLEEGRPNRLTFFVDPAQRIDRVQATVLGATKFLRRGITQTEFLASRHADAEHEILDIAIASSAQALTAILDSARTHRSLPAEQLENSAKQMVSGLRSAHINAWMELVRAHHSGTHQHCLLVTSAAIGWGIALGMSDEDLVTLTAAGLLHDVGKAFVPESILSKPGALTDDEWRQMRRHPSAGFSYLRSNLQDRRVLDVVRHHHEFLDGSGYPDGLTSSQISDLVRFMTICDIYGALVENRSYRPPLPPERAMVILEEMAQHRKLDASMVKSFSSWIMAHQAPVAAART